MEMELNLSDKEIGLLAGRFKILAEPSRLKILRSLFDGERSVNDIVEATGLLQANVSKQLKLLANENILICEQKGLKRYYSISDTTVVQICRLICGSENQGEKQ